MQLRVTQIADLPTSTYHTARYHKNIIFVAGSDWQRKTVPKTQGHMHSAQGLLYRIDDEGIQSFSSDTDMLYIVEVLSKDTLFLGAKTHKNTFQLFSISEQKVIRQKSDEKGGGCYGTLFLTHENELLMNTRNGWLQIIDSTTLKIKESKQITKAGERLWQIHYDEANEVIYTTDYNGTLYKIKKKGLEIVKQNSLLDLYRHNDNHGNPPSLWGISLVGNILVGGDRFGGISLWDEQLHLMWNYRLKKDREIVYDPRYRFPSSEMESVMCLRMLDETHFLFGSRWGNVFLGDLFGKVEKVLNVPMGIQKENSAFAMERIVTAEGVEMLVTFGDGQVYSIQYQKEE